MNKPQPQFIDPAEVRERALRVVREARFPMLATIDGDSPRVRPVSPLRNEGFVLFFANLRSYHKTVEIATNPRVELCYMDAGHNQVRLEGLIDQVTDRRLLQEIWDTNPLLRQYLGSLDNPLLIVYRVRPTRARYMQEWAIEYFEVSLTPQERAPFVPATDTPTA